MSTVKTLGQKLKGTRKERGLTQAKLAESAGIDLRHLQRLEAGLIDCRISTVIKITEALEIEAADLFNQINSAEEPASSDHHEAISNAAGTEFLDVLPVATKIIKTDGLVIYSNEAHTKLTSYPNSEEINGKLFIWDLLFDGPDRYDSQARLRDVTQNPDQELKPFDTLYQTNGENPIPVRVHWNKLTDKQNQLTGFIAIIMKR